MNETLSTDYKHSLELLIDIDQQAIKDFRAGKIVASELVHVSKKNVETVKYIISQIGFPTIASTSKKAYEAAVLVVLHSEDIQLLTQSIKDLQNLDPTSIDRRDIAYMIDKSKIIQNLPQMYGTQYKIGKDNTITYIDIEKPDELEKRRAELGMESFDDYRKKVELSIVDLHET